MNTEIIDNILTLSRQCFNAQDQKKIYNGLSAREAAVIISIINEDESVSGNDLAQRNELSPSRMSRIAESLVSKGYLKRDYSETDRRYIELSLTEKGREQRKRINQFNTQCEQELRDRLSSSEVQVVENAIDILLHAIERK